MIKKTILILFIFLSLVNFASATTWVLYRISSGEVGGISDSHDFASILTDDNFAVIIDPTISDGVIIRNAEGERELGYCKINDNGTIRNATQVEINGFQAIEDDDNNQISADKALNYFKNNPQFRRIMAAYTAILIDYEINVYRQWLTDFKAAVAASTSLANFQSRVAAMDDMPQRTLSQMRTAIENRINKDD